jgi:hypothetical protein
VGHALEEREDSMRTLSLFCHSASPVEQARVYSVLIWLVGGDRFAFETNLNPGVLYASLNDGAYSTAGQALDAALEGEDGQTRVYTGS